jgi:hypothetical protein
MKSLFKSAILAVIVTTPGLSTAGAVTSTVAFVQTNISTDRAYIKFTDNPIESPACATDPRMTIDLTTHAGRAMFTMAVTAKASNKRLYAAGTGSCISKYEKVSYMRLL